VFGCGIREHILASAVVLTAHSIFSFRKEWSIETPLDFVILSRAKNLSFFSLSQFGTNRREILRSAQNDKIEVLEWVIGSTARVSPAEVDQLEESRIGPIWTAVFL